MYSIKLLSALGVSEFASFSDTPKLMSDLPILIRVFKTFSPMFQNFGILRYIILVNIDVSNVLLVIEMDLKINVTNYKQQYNSLTEDNLSRDEKAKCIPPVPFTCWFLLHEKHGNE